MFYLDFHDVVGAKVKKIEIAEKVKCIEITLTNAQNESVELSIFTRKYEEIIRIIIEELAKMEVEE